MKHLTEILWIVVLTGLLTACGGGSSNSDTNNNSGGGSNQNQNQNSDIPQQAVDFSSKSDAELISGANVSMSGGETPKSADKGTDSKTATLSSAQFQGLTGDCANGGTLDVPDNWRFGTYTFNNCDIFNTGLLLDGVIVVAGTIYNDVQFDGWWDFTNFSATENAKTAKFNGRIYGTEQETVSGESGTRSTKDGILRVDVTKGDYKDSLLLSDYTFNYTEDWGTSIQTYDTSYKVSSIHLGGYLNVTTTRTVKKYNLPEQPYPFAGQLEVTGANNAKILITAVEGGNGYPTDNVKVEIDKDGDGTFETILIRTWAEFDRE